MKRNHLLFTALTALLVTLFFAVCASAAEIRPLEIHAEEVDLTNGSFCLTVKDSERIQTDGFFTAILSLEDSYNPAQVKAIVPGDTVRMNGHAWTVQEVVPHGDDESENPSAFEIIPEEEYYGYLAFFPRSDGSFYAVIDDWVPVTPVGEVKVMLPLAEDFSYITISAGEEIPKSADEFLKALGDFGNFNAYNTSCVFEKGLLTEVLHSSYPQGPEDGWMEEDKASAFEAVPVWQFCHGSRDLLETAVITAWETDCEEGLLAAEITEAEKEELRTLALYGVVTGKENDMMVTGGTWLYSFETPEGVHILSLDLYKGLLIGPDGMYTYEIRP